MKDEYFYTLAEQLAESFINGNQIYVIKKLATLHPLAAIKVFDLFRTKCYMDDDHIERLVRVVNRVVPSYPLCNLEHNALLEKE